MLATPSVLFLFSVFTWRMFGVSDPYTLPLPPFRSALIRLTALVNPSPSRSEYAKFPARNRAFLFFRAFWYMLVSPFWIFLWTMDDLFFVGYKEVEIVNPVFLVGGEGVVAS